MFTKAITNSSKFLMMPPTAQLLYIHFGMNADDDGFCEVFSTMRMVEAKPDDLLVLQARGFVKVFDDKVLIITDWKENNYIQKDRYTPSKYLKVYREELKLLENKENLVCIQDVYKMDTQDRLELGKVSIDNTNTLPKVIKKKTEFDPLGAEVLKAFEEVDPKNKTYYGNKTQRGACDYLLKEYGMDEILKRISVLPRTNKLLYFPKINCPNDLKEKWIKLNDAVAAKRSSRVEVII